MGNSAVEWPLIIGVALHFGFYMFGREKPETDSYLLLLATFIYAVNWIYLIHRLLTLLSIKALKFYNVIIATVGIACFMEFPVLCLWRFTSELVLQAFQYLHGKEILNIEPLQCLGVFMLLLALGTGEACGVYSSLFSSIRKSDLRESHRNLRILNSVYLEQHTRFWVTPSQTVLRNRRPLYQKFGESYDDN